jgi:hypothetical protein
LYFCLEEVDMSASGEMEPAMEEFSIEEEIRQILSDRRLSFSADDIPEELPTMSTDLNGCKVIQSGTLKSIVNLIAGRHVQGIPITRKKEKKKRK